MLKIVGFVGETWERPKSLPLTVKGRLFRRDMEDLGEYIVSSVYDITFNIGHAEVVAKSPSIYSMAEIIILSVILTAMMIIIVVGNMLVIIAIATENNLTTVQNWFIASLAMADMMIGRVVPLVEFAVEIL